jgi:putative ABC transport system substrate-binding protein
MIQRRELLTLLGGAAITWPLAAHAQQPAVPVVGWVNAVSAAEWADNVAEFRRGLSETGFVEGRNVAIEFHWAEGHLDRMPVLAADLIGRKVAVIVVGGNIVAVQAAMARTKTIPIVFTTGGDPIAAGIVASLNRPGGNATGFTTLGTELEPKKLELLHEVVSTGTKIALLVNPNNRVVSQDDIQSVNAAARRLGLEIVVVNGGSDSEIEQAFATAVQQRAAALLEGSDAFFNLRREQIAALGLRHALPTMGSGRASVAAGGLMSYGASPADIYRRAGTYVGRILKGEKPGDLPVQQPAKFDLVINLKTAKALGLMISRDFLLLADEVIE